MLGHFSSTLCLQKLDSEQRFVIVVVSFNLTVLLFKVQSPWVLLPYTEFLPLATLSGSMAIVWFGSLFSLMWSCLAAR